MHPHHPPTTPLGCIIYIHNMANIYIHLTCHLHATLVHNFISPNGKSAADALRCLPLGGYSVHKEMPYGIAYLELLLSGCLGVEWGISGWWSWMVVVTTYSLVERLWTTSLASKCQNARPHSAHIQILIIMINVEFYQGVKIYRVKPSGCLCYMLSHFIPEIY